MSEFTDKIKEKTNKAKNGVKKLVKAIEENPKTSALLAEGFVSIVLSYTVGNGNNKKSDNGAWIKDSLTGLDIKLTHKLNNSEIIELSNRIKSGMSLLEGLSSMGLIAKERRRK